MIDRAKYGCCRDGRGSELVYVEVNCPVATRIVVIGFADFEDFNNCREAMNAYYEKRIGVPGAIKDAFGDYV